MTRLILCAFSGSDQRRDFHHRFVVVVSIAGQIPEKVGWCLARAFQAGARIRPQMTCLCSLLHRPCSVCVCDGAVSG